MATTTGRGTRRLAAVIGHPLGVFKGSVLNDVVKNLVVAVKVKSLL